MNPRCAAYLALPTHLNMSSIRSENHPWLKAVRSSVETYGRFNTRVLHYGRGALPCIRVPRVVYTAREGGKHIAYREESAEKQSTWMHAYMFDKPALSRTTAVRHQHNRMGPNLYCSNILHDVGIYGTVCRNKIRHLGGF